jgi:hypothetical protein
MLFRRIGSSQSSSVPGWPLPLPVDVTQQICVDVQIEMDDVVKVLARCPYFVCFGFSDSYVGVLNS